MTKRRLLPLVILALGLLGFAWISPHLPHDQRVEIALGNRASNVNTVHIRYSHGGEAVREVELSYPSGAPRDVTQTPHLADGDYAIEIETDGKDGLVLIKRNVYLEEKFTTQIHAEGS